jgi:hypothetical protein
VVWSTLFIFYGRRVEICNGWEFVFGATGKIWCLYRYSFAVLVLVRKLRGQGPREGGEW